MRSLHLSRVLTRFLASSAALSMLGSAMFAVAQQPASRIADTIRDSSHASLKGTVSPRIKEASDEGRASSNLELRGLSLVLEPTAAQKADLAQLLVAQQTPGSSSYQQWLTPARYAARFGVSDADLEKLSAWLRTEGFAVAGANNSHTRITFSGTAGQVETAFGTELHRYSVNGEQHVANATQIEIPSSLAGIVSGVMNISDFRPKPRIRHSVGTAYAPRYTDGVDSSHYLTPADLTTIYDTQTLYTAGYTGAGQRIAIAGQSAVVLSDVANFRAAAGLAANAPTAVLVPNTGTSTIYPGDESESDLDLEYSGAVAKNASIYFVYTGNNTNSGVFNALEYAVDTDLAPIISISYGNCEANLSTSEFNALELVVEQANTQGQTIFSASGDQGATDCDESSSTTITSATHGLAVDYPAASQYVTGVGGTMFNAGSGTYWNTTNTSAGGSAISYIPEEAWNETTSRDNVQYGGSGLLGGGGGASTFTAKPSWQTGTGVPSDGKRDVPDFSMDAAVYDDGYLYCSSDTTSGVTNSCSNGFLNSANTSQAELTVAGGTSFAAPIAAGVLALVNQKTSSTGQGNLNTKLYAIAAATPSAFHDITVGNNSQPCTAASTGCPSGGDIGFSAGTGYDQATGLGTLDVTNFANAFSTTTTATLLPTTVTLSPSSPSVAAGTAVTITATVAVSSGSGTPTGTVQFAVDGTNEGSAVALSGSTATYSFSSATTGNHIVSATYSGSATYATSYAVDTVAVTTTTTTTNSGTFNLSGTAATASLGSSATSLITVTPTGGFTGTVYLSATSSSTVLLADGCASISNPTVTGSAAVTSALTILTNSTACNTAVAAGKSVFRFLGTQQTSSRNRSPFPLPTLPVSAAAMLGGAICLLRGRNGSRVFLIAGAFLLTGVALTAVGCGSSTTASSTNDVPAGTYTLTVNGATTSGGTPVASTTVTLTIS